MKVVDFHLTGGLTAGTSKGWTTNKVSLGWISAFHQAYTHSNYWCLLSVNP
jgi:hypothetical protein